MRDCLLLVDVFDDFRHEGGASLLASVRARYPRLHELVRGCRDGGEPIVYANDSFGVFDGDARRIVDRARRGPGGAYVDGVAPLMVDRFVFKPRYSAFAHTPLELILRDLEIERVLLAGMATERCVAQTAIDASESGFEVTVITPACATVDEGLERVALAYLTRVVGVDLAGSLAEARSQPARPTPAWADAAAAVGTGAPWAARLRAVPALLVEGDRSGDRRQ